MTATLIRDLARHIGLAYRDLVRALADEEDVDYDAAAETLGRCNRTPGELDGDAARLRRRRQAVARLAEAERMADAIEAAQKTYSAALAAETKARAALDVASRDFRNAGDIKARTRRDAALADVRRATTARANAFETLQDLKRRQDEIRKPALTFLAATADPAGDPLSADNFALT